MMMLNCLSFCPQAAWEEKRNHRIAVEKAQREAEERAREEEDLAECTFSPKTTPVPNYLKKMRQVEAEPDTATKAPSPWEPLPPSSLARKRVPGCWGMPSAPGSVEQQRKVPAADDYPYSPGKSYVSMCLTPPRTSKTKTAKAPKTVKAGKKKLRDEAPPDGEKQQTLGTFPEKNVTFCELNNNALTYHTCMCQTLLSSAGQPFALLAGLKHILDWQSQNVEPTSHAKEAAGGNDGWMKNSQQQQGPQKVPEVPAGDGSSMGQRCTACEDAEGELSLDQQDEAETSGGDDDQLLDNFDFQLAQEANSSPLVTADSDDDDDEDAQVGTVRKRPSPSLSAALLFPHDNYQQRG